MSDQNRRVFIGTFLSLKEQERLGALRQFDEQLSAQWQCKIRWVRPEKLHLTWFFIGSVKDNDLPAVSEICREVSSQFGPSKLEFELPAFWPRARGARMMAITPYTVPEPVIQLAHTLKKRCAKFAEKENKRYRPHITLMRFEGNDRKHKLDVPEFFPLQRVLPVPLDIEHISIIESHLGANSSYQALEDFKLRAPTR